MPITILSYNELYAALRGMDVKEPTSEELQSLKGMLELKITQINKELALRLRG